MGSFWREVLDRLREEEKSEAEEAWDDFVRASDRYSEARRALFETDPLPAVRKALNDGGDMFAALDLLMDVGWNRPELVRAVVPELYSCSLSLGRPGIFARLVLRRLSGSGPEYAEALHAELAPLTAATLREEVTDVFAMQALAMLLDDVGASDLLGRWREAVLASPDVDVRELAEDYGE
ncbi:hypothetical protein ACFS5L_33495 [Streptomyces phyllanthi]|uniref:HEAT repeat domain-containing protein n=1 Tax=Streptomyces phyllanthi TaxID=1803180 RepID=A0A5N8W015_9ACTN|nr:hypothetical protein [Streptomyces phyllanthi]MPY40841.1 hypothetical protein [Streptomyces phyllanthi]